MFYVVSYCSLEYDAALGKF